MQILFKKLLAITLLCTTFFPKESLFSRETENVVVLGGGVGALSSAVYLSRANLSPLVIVGDAPGGLLIQSQTIQNWPGEMEVDGATLTDRIRKQAEANGARFLEEEVIAVDFSKKPYRIVTRSLLGSTEKKEIFAESCIIAMGTKPNFLQIPGESTYWGRGVSNCAVCDGSLYAGQKVGVVGGGDAAVLEAMYLSEIAKEVYLFVRGEGFRAVEENRLQALFKKPNVKILYSTQVEEILGDKESVKEVRVKKGGQESFKVSLDGLFLAIGSNPNSALFQGILELDAKGYIQLTKDQETSIPGVYAVGDIVDPVYKQAISAAGDGARAALQAQKYLADRSSGLIAKKSSIENTSLEVSVIEVSSVEQFYQEIESSSTPVAIDFYASWCMPCKKISPFLEASANELKGKIKFLKVNVEKLPALSAAFKIRGMPTLIVVDPSGKELSRKVGTEEIAALIKDLKEENPSLEKSPRIVF